MYHGKRRAAGAGGRTAKLAKPDEHEAESRNLTFCSILFRACFLLILSKVVSDRTTNSSRIDVKNKVVSSSKVLPLLDCTGKECVGSRVDFVILKLVDLVHALRVGRCFFPFPNMQGVS